MALGTAPVSGGSSIAHKVFNILAGGVPGPVSNLPTGPLTPTPAPVQPAPVIPPAIQQINAGLSANTYTPVYNTPPHRNVGWADYGNAAGQILTGGLGPTSPGVVSTGSTQNAPRTGLLSSTAPNVDEYQGLNPNKFSETWRQVDAQGYDYLKMLDIATADRTKILDRVRLQAQMSGLPDDQLPAFYNQLLPQYASAASQATAAQDASNTANSQRTARMAQIQAYLMPQLNGFLQTAQNQANAYGASNNDPSYGYYQAQANAAYAAQLAALTNTAALGSQQQAPVPTLDDFLKQALAQTAPITVQK